MLSKLKKLYKGKNNGVHIPSHTQLSIQIQVQSTHTHMYKDSMMLISSC